jgi:hypothetical protein
MGHAFGDQLRQVLSQKHGLSQSRLAEGVGLAPPVISAMCQGERLTGPRARDRVLAIAVWLQQQGALTSQAAATALFAAAGMVGLRPEVPAEEALLQRLDGPSDPATTAVHAPTVAGSLPPLPSLVIGRADAVADLRARLTRTAGMDPAAATQTVVAMRGWPGVGKTTLAATLAHDPALAAAFPDGVFWTSLGQTPTLFAELAAWGRTLGVPEVVTLPSLDAALQLLRSILREKRVCLIVDDVWTADAAQQMNIGGRHSALLITTRLWDVAQKIAPTPEQMYTLPVLPDDQALELLRRLAPGVVAAYPDQSSTLVRELEGLPLAIQVAGRMLAVEARYQWGVEDLLRELRDGVRMLQAEAPPDLFDTTQQTTPTVAVLLQKSTDRLDAATRDGFALLGAFAPKPATFDAAALHAVWMVDDPRPMIRTLVSRGLLEPVDAQRFQMHALLVAHARSLLTEDA